ncbi:hypothetical protein WJX73_002859 [Symbiochloris irregularis]|uniref:Serine-threonine/tyrosine-protein kinase catalytic domain-containing protein n=1 Tax=Symbiochloris irregularis TaxID=706552 RepID=A0AAW1PRH7_9CHLO
MDPVEAVRLASKGKRPHLSKLASSDAVMKVLRELIERCWHQEPTKRPSFVEIVGILDGQVNKLPRREVLGGGGGQTGGNSGCCSVQ